MGSYSNPIVSGLQAGLQLRQSREAREQDALRIENEKQRINDERQYHQDTIQEAKDRLSQAGKQFEATNKLAQQAAQLQLLGHQQAAMDHLLKGDSVPGITANPSTNPNPQTVTYNVAPDHPLFPQTQITLPHPEVYAQHQADLERIGLKPKTEQKIAETQAGKEEDYKRTIDLETAKAQAQSQLKQYELSVQKLMADQRNATTLGAAGIHANAALGAAQIHGEASKAAAKIRTGVALFDPDGGGIDPQPYIQGILNGTLTDKQLDSSFKGAPAASNYIKQMVYQGANGAQPLSDVQQKNLSNYHSLTDLIPKLQQLANGSVLNPLQNYELGKEIQGEIAKVANTLGGDKGQRLQKMLIEKADGLVPGPLTPKNIANERVNNYIRVLTNSFNDEFNGNSAAQRDHFATSIGLTKYWGSNGGQAGQAPQQGTPQQPTPPVGAPQAPGATPSAPRVMKYNPTTGRLEFQ